MQADLISEPRKGRPGRCHEEAVGGGPRVVVEGLEQVDGPGVWGTHCRTGHLLQLLGVAVNDKG